MTKEAPSQVVSGICSWLKQRGVWWDSELVEIRGGVSGCTGPSLGVFALKDVASGQKLCSIPKTALLSRVNSAIAAEVEAAKLGGSLGLIVAVMYERARGEASPWCGYLDSLPLPGEHVPLFWEAGALRHLEGTDLEHKAKADRALVAGDYADDVAPFLEQHRARFCPEGGRGPPGVEEFKAAASWVASRAFYVDEEHGEAMVPLADIFNHKASVVQLTDEYAVAEEMAFEYEHDGSSEDGGDEGRGSGGEENEEGGGEEGNSGREGEEKEGGGEQKGDEEKEGGGGEEGGSGGEGAGKREEEGGEEAGARPTTSGAATQAAAAERQQQQQQQEGQSNGHAAMGHACGSEQGACGSGGSACATTVACATAAHGGGGEAAPSAMPAINREGHGGGGGLLEREGLKLEMAICSIERDGVDMLEIVAASPIRSGAEVHNTYGEYGNSELVNRYGFALRTNPFDSVQISKEDFTSLMQQRLGTTEWRRRSRFLKQHSDLLEEDDEPFAVRRPATLSLSLLIALRATCAPTAEFGRYRDVMDVLQAAVQDAPPGADVEIDPEEETEYFVEDVQYGFNGHMREALAALCDVRLGRYPAGREATLARLEELESGGGGAAAAAGPAEPGMAAERAALLLRLGEQVILEELRDAVLRGETADKAQQQQQQRTEGKASTGDAKSEGGQGGQAAKKRRTR